MRFIFTILLLISIGYNELIHLVVSADFIEVYLIDIPVEGEKDIEWEDKSKKEAKLILQNINLPFHSYTDESSIEFYFRFLHSDLSIELITPPPEYIS